MSLIRWLVQGPFRYGFRDEPEGVIPAINRWGEPIPLARLTPKGWVAIPLPSPEYYLATIQKDACM